jgi:hypothetical protein
MVHVVIGAAGKSVEEVLELRKKASAGGLLVKVDAWKTEKHVHHRASVTAHADNLGQLGDGEKRASVVSAQSMFDRKKPVTALDPASSHRSASSDDRKKLVAPAHPPTAKGTAPAKAPAAKAPSMLESARAKTSNVGRK